VRTQKTFYRISLIRNRHSISLDDVFVVFFVREVDTVDSEHPLSMSFGSFGICFHNFFGELIFFFVLSFLVEDSSGAFFWADIKSDADHFWEHMKAHSSRYEYRFFAIVD